MYYRSSAAPRGRDMLRIVDRYLIREALTPTLLALLVLTFILEIPPVMQVAESLIAKGVPAGTIAQIMATLLPQALGLTIPMSLLIGLLIGLGRLSADREMVALQACGVSLYRLVRPVGVLAVLAWTATTYVFIWALPDANQRFREITYRVVTERAEKDVKPRVFFEDFPSMVLYVRDVPPSGGWEDVFLADTRQPGSPDVYLAEHGRVLLDRSQRRVDLILENGIQHRLSAKGPAEYRVVRFQRTTIRLDPEAMFPRTGPQRGDPELTIAELRAEADRLRAEGRSPHRQIMTIHQKFSIPLACLVFAVIGLGLGVTSRRDGKLASFVLGIGVIFVYYVIMYMGEAMAKGALLSPHVARWIPDVILGAAGVGLLIHRARSTEGALSLTVRVPLPSWRQGPVPATMAKSRPAQTRPSERVLVIRVPRVRFPTLSILDRYIARTYLKVLGLAFVGMLGIFYISTFIDLSDKLFKRQATGWMLLQYFWYQTPQFVYYVLAISALVATLVTVGVFTKTSELVVMKACGISVYRVAAPLLLFGALWSLTLFGLEETILAPANRRALALNHLIRTGRAQDPGLVTRRWVVGRSGSVYHYVDFDSAKNRLYGLSIYDIDAGTWQLRRRTFVPAATYTDTWRAENGWMREFDAAGGNTYATFTERELPIEPPDYLVAEQPDAERMTYAQLKQYITELQASGLNVIRYSVQLQRKIAFPFVTIIMTLMAVPFAVTTGSRGALYGIGAGLVFAMAYWILNSIFAAIGSAGLLSPALAAWAPNIMFAAGATYLMLSVRT
ncbi:MAG: LPS export ABC transporter permease LptF [Acidobacteria bacterium]|nr:LPS export ABC transporter permease LptF [Acidobacteriota bacterium]